MAEQNQVTKKTEATVAKESFKLPFNFQPKSLVPANKIEWIRFGEGSVVGSLITLGVSVIVGLFKKND